MPTIDDYNKVVEALIRAQNMLERSKQGKHISVNYSFKPARSCFDNEPVTYL